MTVVGCVEFNVLMINVYVSMKEVVGKNCGLGQGGE
jgi:hypothetical protein